MNIVKTTTLVCLLTITALGGSYSAKADAGLLGCDPKVLEKNKIKISLLHLDLDVFTATKFALEKLYPLVSKNGIILLDDYNQIY